MATTQYRRPIQYSEANLTDAKNNLAHIQTAFDNLKYREKDAQDGDDAGVQKQVTAYTNRFIDAMDDDINVQNGIAVVYELVKAANTYAQQATVYRGGLKEFEAAMVKLVSIFGIKLVATDNEIDDEKIKALIEERNQARKNKNFARSDQIRDDLKKQGIILEDTPQGTRYKKE
jgi:Cysteinyl-tRNA synthetase